MLAECLWVLLPGCQSQNCLKWQLSQVGQLKKVSLVSLQGSGKGFNVVRKDWKFLRTSDAVSRTNRIRKYICSHNLELSHTKNTTGLKLMTFWLTERADPSESPGGSQRVLNLTSFSLPLLSREGYTLIKSNGKKSPRHLRDDLDCPASLAQDLAHIRSNKLAPLSWSLQEAHFSLYFSVSGLWYTKVCECYTTTRFVHH